MGSYTFIVARKLWIAFVFGVFTARLAFPDSQTQQDRGEQQAQPQHAQAPPGVPPDAVKDLPPPPPEASPPEEDNPPEEDESVAPDKYSFNPLRAKQVLEIGNFYWKKHKYKGAEERFLEATRWNPGWAEAYLRLGEAELKLRRKDNAKKAFAKVVELAPESKEAKLAQKQAEKL
jgi:tetratricopeptide (TPR) repeat protein